MQKGLKLTGQMRALAMALCGAIGTSVIAMLTPAHIFESITGSTGISELVPATGAPLGDTARALIAFGFGSTAFALIAALLLRKPADMSSMHTSPAKAEVAEPLATPADNASFVARVRERINAYVEHRRARPVITELSDLPKLRAGDAHPDAPPRRPISAHTDFAEIVAEPPLFDETAQAESGIETLPVENLAVETVAIAEAFPPESEAVAAMVNRLETAVALREEQLAKLEGIARIERAKADDAIVLADDVAAEISAPAPRATLLEAVPSAPVKLSGPDEMDAALRSALETLHRMNARTR
jgi:hypothetical protein